MKTIGNHAKHALALFLALIMLFGIVSVPVFAYEDSTASTGGEDTPSAGGGESGGESSDTSGTKDTPWYTLTYDYATKQMTLVIKTDILSYADPTAADLAAFKDEFFDAMAHMLVGDISEIKKLAPSTETSEDATLCVVTLPDFAPLLDGGTTELSEREKQLRAFLESRGITKVSQIDFEAIIPVLIQLGYVTYEELAAINWDRVFAKFEEELEKEIDRDIAADIAKENGFEEPAKVEEPSTVVPDETAPDYEEKKAQREQEEADYNKYLEEKTAYEEKIEEIVSKKDSDEYRETFEEKANSEEIVNKKNESLGQITDAKEKVEKQIEGKKGDSNADERSDVLLAEAILKALNGITLDGHKIYDGTHLLTDAVRAVLRELPTVEEIAGYTDEEMKHTWSVYAESAFGDSTFDFTISLDGAGNLVRKLARLVADTVIVERRDDGTFFVTLNLPQKLTDLILRACNSEKFRDSEWKDRIFGHIAEDGNRIYALVNDVTFDEIISALEEIDFEGILSREDIKDIYDLSGLTNDEIIAKLRKTERFYKRALSLFNKFFTRLPDSVKGKTLFDFYRGNGTFRAEGRKENLNVEAWLNRLLPEAYKSYAGLIAGMLDSETVTVALNATVNFTDMYKVTFAGDKNEIGFLPAGAKLSDFVKATTYRGYPILGWTDVEGNSYTKMPAADTVLYPVIDATVVAKLVYTESEIVKTYDNASATLRVTVTYDEQGESVTYAYQWYKDGVKIEGATSDTLTVKNVADSGGYTCTVTVTDGTAVYHATSDEATVAIAQRLYTFKDNFRWDYTAPFYPDGDEHTVTLLPEVDAYANVKITYTGDARTKSTIGSYTTGATVTFENENCALSGSIDDLHWAVGATETAIVTEDGGVIGKVTLKTSGVAIDPSYIFRAKAVTAPDIAALLAILPAGVDSVKVPYTFDFAFYDAVGNRKEVKSALEFSFFIDPAICKTNIAFFRMTGDALTLVDSARTDDALTYESDALLTSDSVQYALVSYLYQFTAEADGYRGTYDGLDHQIALRSLSYGRADAEVTYSYQWFKGNEKITGATASSHEVKNAADSGVYTLVVTLTDGYVEQSVRVTVNVAIDKLTVDLSRLTWSASEFPYHPGEEQTVTLVVPDDYAVANLAFTYTDNVATKPGIYTAKATVASYDDANCALTGTISAHSWTISNRSQSVFDHFGNKITVTAADSFPDGYVLCADWVEGLPLPDGLVEGASCVLIGAHRVYFKDASGNNVNFPYAVTVSFVVPEAGEHENLKLVLLEDEIYTVTDATREDGTMTVELPRLDKDATLALVAYRFPLTIDTSDDVNATYDPAQEFILRVTPRYYNAALSFTYQWYKDGVKIEEATSNTLTVKNVADSGKYTCEVTVVDGDATVTAMSGEITVNLAKKVIDTADVSLPEFVYRLMKDDRTIEITAELLNHLPAGVTATIDTESADFGYRATEVGEYTVRVYFALDDAYAENYELDTASRSLRWKINHYNIRLGTPIWNYADTLTYCGSAYVFTVPAWDENPYLDVTYRDNQAKDAGTYTVSVIATPKNANCHINDDESITVRQNFRIEPKIIGIDLVEWAEETFVYDGETHRPSLRDFGSYTIAGVNEPLSDILVLLEYEGVFASEVLPAGATPYTVTACLAVKEGNSNYRLAASKKVLEWNMTPKTLDTDGVRLEENLFDYDGETKTVALRADSIPEELLATLDSSTEITATERGYHSVTVRFALKAGLSARNYSFDSSVNISYRIVTAIDPADFAFADGDLVYNGSEQSVPDLSFGDFATLVRIADAEGTVRATDAGVYKVTYTFDLTNDALYRLTEESYTYEWTIAKQKIVVGTLHWDYTNPFVYAPDLTHKVAILDEIENVVITYHGASATDAGDYLARATLIPVSENYEIVLSDSESLELSWTVEQAVIRVPLVEWAEGNAFVYDGNVKNVGLRTELSDDITVTYTDAAMTDAGTYRAVATLLAKDKNYRVVIGDTDTNVATLDWEITPAVVIVGTPEWNFTEREFVFDTADRSFRITNLPEHIRAVYENHVIGNVGTYTLTVTLIADKNYKIEGVTTDTFTYTVTPQIITVDASDLRWTTDAVSERYDGKTHTYTLRGVPAHVVIRYTDNAKSAVGAYTASATLTAESENYTLVVNGEIPTRSWSIVKGVYDMSGVKFEDKTVEYDGKAHALTISGKLPAGVSVTYNRSNLKDAGVYVVTATFTGNQNYEAIPSMTATLTITRAIYTIATDGNDTLIITAPNGLTYTLMFIEKETSEYKGQSFLGIGTLNEKIALSAVYDIFFTEDGETEVHPEGNFEVKLLIPETLRKKNIKVVHLCDDGKLADMEATRDGDYMVFTTDGFSVYFLVEATKILPDIWILGIMIALLVLLVLIVVIDIVAWRKKKKKRAARKEYPDILKGADPTVFNLTK